MAYYPVMMDVTDRECLIVGGGEVALRKAQSLIEADARVTVIAPEVDPRLESMPDVAVIKRPYRDGDACPGYALIFAATGDREVNSMVSDEAQRNGIPVNIVDDPELCSFIVPSSVRRGDLILAISTSGKSPALSKKIRKELEEQFGPEYGQLVELLGELRDEVKSRYASLPEREAAFSRLLSCGILELLREGKTEQAREKALQCI